MKANHNTNEVIVETIQIDATSADKLNSYFRERSVELVMWLRENDDKDMKPVDVFDKFNN